MSFCYHLLISGQNYFCNDFCRPTIYKNHYFACHSNVFYIYFKTIRYPEMYPNILAVSKPRTVQQNNIIAGLSGDFLLPDMIYE